MQRLNARNIAVSKTPDRRNLEILFEDNAVVDMLKFVESTETTLGKRLGAGDDKIDSWNVERLERRDENDYGKVEHCGG